jgi:hypothetical protein
MKVQSIVRQAALRAAVLAALIMATSLHHARAEQSPGQIPPFSQQGALEASSGQAEQKDSQARITVEAPLVNAIIQSSAFEQMKRDLAPITAKAEKEEIEKPSLLMTKEEGCESPKTLEYKPDRPIEELCSSLPRTQVSASKDSNGTDGKQPDGSANQIKEIKQ